MITTIEIVPSKACPGTQIVIISSPSLEMMFLVLNTYVGATDAIFGDFFRTPDGGWAAMGRTTACDILG